MVPRCLIFSFEVIPIYLFDTRRLFSSELVQLPIPEQIELAGIDGFGSGLLKRHFWRGVGNLQCRTDIEVPSQEGPGVGGAISFAHIPSLSNVYKVCSHWIQSMWRNKSIKHTQVIPSLLAYQLSIPASCLTFGG